MPLINKNNERNAWSVGSIIGQNIILPGPCQILNYIGEYESKNIFDGSKEQLSTSPQQDGNLILCNNKLFVWYSNQWHILFSNNVSTTTTTKGYENIHFINGTINT